MGYLSSQPGSDDNLDFVSTDETLEGDGTPMSPLSVVYPEDIGILDSSGDRINPATEEKQDDIISAIGAIPTTDVSALATELTLGEIKIIIDYLSVVLASDESVLKIVDETAGTKFSVENIERFLAEEVSVQNLEGVKSFRKDDYKISDLADGDTSYFGFLKSDGSWYIMSLTETEARYVKGDDDYSTNWTDRESLTYDYYNNIF
jgi:hypothetical protein